ncbi:MAG: phage portal protein, partial [Gemmatimonadota bacterium]
RRGASIRRNLADANTVTARTLPKLRAGAHDLVRNNPHARRGIEAIVSNVVGAGIAPQFLRDKRRAEDIETLAKRHLGSTDCDVEGRHTYLGLEAAAMQAVAESGEVLVRRRRRRMRDGLPVPVQFQLLEADYLDATKDGPTREGGVIVQGVEYDAIGRRRAYWLYREHPGSTRFRAESRPVPARDIAHVYRMDRPGQVRGIPWLAPVMLQLADWADFADAQLVRQKIAACFVAFVHEPFDHQDPRGVTENDDGQLIDQFEPGMVERLPPGAQVEFGDPPTVSDYEPYARITLQSVAAGLGVSYEALTGDLRGVNFSSGKMGRLEFDRNSDRWREHMFIPQFCDPLTRWFLEAAELVGARTADVDVRHIAPARAMIDPPREFRAERDAIRSGQKTHFQAIRERGRDPVEHFEEYSEALETLDRLGIVVDSDARRRTTSGLATADAGSAGGDGGEAGVEAMSDRLQGLIEDLEDLLALSNGRHR